MLTLRLACATPLDVSTRPATDTVFDMLRIEQLMDAAALLTV